LIFFTHRLNGEESFCIGHTSFTFRRKV
jgi:hypothetical protein